MPLFSQKNKASMTFSKTFVSLDTAIHDRLSFDCNEAKLNQFIKTQAAKHMKAGVSKTLVLPSITPLLNKKYSICSYFTVAPSSIKKNSLPIKLGKKLPHYPVPVFLIAQLAVHKNCKGKGLGKITLVKSLEYLWKVNKQMHAYAVIVDCLNNEVEQFYSKYGFQILCIQNEKTRMFLPMKTIAQLFE